ncbi:hypothetical protein GCM10009836_63960 [Pseudonocardia ailaonensis]|uniref:Uncharacterized protein n=1 Tax=Pseudonocardia ailaonensis TaxID=367279 RepID=A0ABN2NL60_9PSEU
MSRTVRARIPEPRAGIPLPQLEILLGGAAWVAGALGLGTGGGTLIMALGLLVTGWAFVSLRRRHGLGARLDGRLRLRVFRLGIGVLVVLVALGIVLPLIGNGWGELTVPLGVAVVGAALFPLSTTLGERSFVAVGGLLVVIGAIGALLALNTAGTATPLGVVGFGSAAVLWAAAARRLGVVGELRARVGR